MKLITWPYYQTEFLAAQGLSPTFVKRFWSKVKVTDGCWEWLASFSMGYGQIGRQGHKGAPIKAHVASWILHFGPVPHGLQVLHKCDYRPCTRPDHLFLGTQIVNMHDMVQKGRLAKWERHGRSILTIEQVCEIRNRYVRGNRWHQKENATALAKEYGVSVGTIWEIARGKTTWRGINRRDPNTICV